MSGGELTGMGGGRDGGEGEELTSLGGGKDGGEGES